jgi:hypothetical protein
VNGSLVCVSNLNYEPGWLDASFLIRFKFVHGYMRVVLVFTGPRNYQLYAGFTDDNVKPVTSVILLNVTIIDMNDPYGFLPCFVCNV